ncbi:hypothetical protein [Microbacterium rhizomatis]|uniref:DUF916 domain-containing protein n=1 Tax=Microbacterium rhizomatis TaxID=1631477 RepID=A0A5J5J0D9_9MICO|nr:hypothetical protein [Microbacterium rhizomatis]KAA9107986.1 hypothetical protein F6B43_11225 [Microbacterium rhizomatis]
MPSDTVSSTLSRSHTTVGRVRALLIVLAALVAAILVPGSAFAEEATPAPTSDSMVSWGARPADTLQGSGRPNFNYELPAGGTLSDALIVTNHGDETLELDVYAADGYLTADGTLDILPGGESSVELGEWIVLETDHVTLASGQSAQVPFEVVLPDDIQPGDYAAGIVASMRVEAADGVTTERRLGSRVLLRVQGDLLPSLGVTDVVVDYSGTLNPFQAGSATVSYTLVNTGNARLAPGATVAVGGPFGLGAVSVVDPGVPELLPGSSIVRVVQVDGVLPTGLVTGTVTADAEIVERTGSAAGPLPAVSTASGSATTWGVPWTLLVVLVLLIGLIVWAAVARRRRKVAHQREIDEAVAAALGERTVGDFVGGPDAAPAAPAPEPGVSEPVTETTALDHQRV